MITNHYYYSLVCAHNFQQETSLQFITNAHDMVSTIISIFIIFSPMNEGHANNIG